MTPRHLLMRFQAGFPDCLALSFKNALRMKRRGSVTIGMVHIIEAITMFSHNILFLPLVRIGCCGRQLLLRTRRRVPCLVGVASGGVVLATQPCVCVVATRTGNQYINGASPVRLNRLCFFCQY